MLDVMNWRSCILAVIGAAILATGPVVAGPRGDPTAMREDVAHAVRWFKFAANRGDASAQFSLGAMYCAGRGVTRDYVQAYKWLALAEAGGIEVARKKRDSVGSRMAPADIEQARRMARRWRSNKH